MYSKLYREFIMLIQAKITNKKTSKCQVRRVEIVHILKGNIKKGYIIQLGGMVKYEKWKGKYFLSPRVRKDFRGQQECNLYSYNKEHCHQGGEDISVAKLPNCLCRMATPDFMMRIHRFTLQQVNHKLAFIMIWYIFIPLVLFLVIIKTFKRKTLVDTQSSI